MDSPNHRPNRDAAEAEIRAVETAYDLAWAAADVDRLMSLLAPDVVIINPTGEISVGATEVRQLLQAFLAGRGLASTHASRAKRVSFVTDDVALFDGEARIEGPNLREPLIHDFTDVFVRSDGQWKIAHIRAYVFLDAGGS